MKRPWDDVTAHAIGAHWLEHEIAPKSPLGRAARRHEHAFVRGDETRARDAIGRVAAFAAGLDRTRVGSANAILERVLDPRTAVARASGGGVLGDVELFTLARFVEALGELHAAVGDTALAGDAPEPLSEMASLLAPGMRTPGAFYIADDFAPSLGTARDDAERRGAAFDLARSRVAERAARYAGFESVRDGEFTLMRDELRGSLPPEIRIVREAPAYLLCELALDDAALAALAARDEALAQTAEEEERVRVRLSAAIAAAAAQLEAAADALGAFDALLARIAFAQRHSCVAPEISDEPRVVFEDARYVPLAALLAEHARSYAPISLELDAIGVVTGPNMGGKTTALRTLGFLAACVAFGVPVPAARATLPLFDRIAWLGIGAAEVEDSLLSAFGSEVIAVHTFLSDPATRALVLVDEFARTTSPREGRALLVALLETVRERGAVALAATHLAHVTPSGGANHFTIGVLGALGPADGTAVDLDTALARIARAMDYRIRRVEADDAPASDAIALAGALGLEPALIARAKAHL